ncbi:ABC transporter permease [Undibacterium sp. RuTC16W]|uniref:ABC transporter permease n=1 Tax=Undibacterium sp. RuTC16W TaxID=3413048 RepID=UPI003BF41D3E
MHKQIATIGFYTFIEALRNRLIWAVILIALIGIGFSGFLNEIALTESRQIQLALMAAFFRFAAVFLLATFVVSSMLREFNDKGLELLLSLALPRAAYLLGKWSGFAALAILIALLFGTIISFLAPFSPVIWWTISLLFELWIIAAFSMLCVLTLSQMMGALSAVIGFYVLTRSISAIQLIGNDPVNIPSNSQQLISFLVNSLSAVLPHLDEFTRTDWLLYQSGSWSVLLALLLQAAMTLLLLGAASLFDFYRKNI